MSGATKDTIQKILLIALAAMTLSMVCISVYNQNDNENEKDAYLENEKLLVKEELKEIIKNYDHLTKEHQVKTTEVLAEKQKVKKLLEELEDKVLDYSSITKYRREMLELRKRNQYLQHELHDGMSTGHMQSVY